MDHLRAPGHFPSRQSVELIFCTQTLCFRHQSGFRYRHNRQGGIIMNSKQVVLITGSSTGFGRLFAETMARKGHTVFATMRDPGGRNAKNASEIRALAEKESLPIPVLEMDVTNDISVERAVDAAVAKAGRIDVAINNAGYYLSGLEEDRKSVV